jgi:hypothetical protein
MVPMLDLWLPIVVSAVLVFVVSSVVHMALPLHKKDFQKLPNEDQVLSSLRTHGIPPGQYMFPCAGSMKEMGSPEMLAKLKQGPVGNMIVRPSGTFSMGASLLQWFVLSLVISACAGYVAGLALPSGTDLMLVFRVTSTVALVGYAVSHATDSIWKGLSWSVTAKFFIDGLAYALVTGGTFAWMWPAGSV